MVTASSARSVPTAARVSLTDSTRGLAASTVVGGIS